MIAYQHAKYLVLCFQGLRAFPQTLANIVLMEVDYEADWDTLEW